MGKKTAPKEKRPSTGGKGSMKPPRHGGPTAAMIDQSNILDRVRNIVHSADSVPRRSTSPSEMSSHSTATTTMTSRREQLITLGGKQPLFDGRLSSKGPDTEGFLKAYGAAGTLMSDMLKEWTSRVVMLFEVGLDSGSSYAAAWDAMVLEKSPDHMWELKPLGSLFAFILAQLRRADVKYREATVSGGLGKRMDVLTVSKAEMMKAKNDAHIEKSLAEINEKMSNLVRLKTAQQAQLAAGHKSTATVGLIKEEIDMTLEALEKLDDKKLIAAGGNPDVADKVAGKLRQLAVSETTQNSSATSKVAQLWKDSTKRSPKQLLEIRACPHCNLCDAHGGAARSPSTSDREDPNSPTNWRPEGITQQTSQSAGHLAVCEQDESPRLLTMGEASVSPRRQEPSPPRQSVMFRGRRLHGNTAKSSSLEVKLDLPSRPFVTPSQIPDLHHIDLTAGRAHTARSRSELAVLKTQQRDVMYTEGTTAARKHVAKLGSQAKKDSVAAEHRLKHEATTQGFASRDMAQYATEMGAIRNELGMQEPTHPVFRTPAAPRNPNQFSRTTTSTSADMDDLLPPTMKSHTPAPSIDSPLKAAPEVRPVDVDETSPQWLPEVKRHDLV